MLTEAQIIDGLKCGDEAAFEAFYEKYAAILLNHLFCMVGKSEVAEEILHEVFMTVLTKINFYQNDPSLKNSFKSWVFRIATNRAIDEIRRTKNVRFEEISLNEKNDVDVEEEYEVSWRNHKIQTLVEKLPLGQRTFLSLKLENDLGHMEIARICSCQVNAVKQGLFQARRTLKNLMLAEGIEL